MATNRASGERLRGAAAVSTTAASATAANARAFRRPAPVYRVEHQPDHLGGEEEQLGPVRQADEQIETAEDSDRSDNRCRRRAKLAFGIGLTPAQRKHDRADGN